MKKPFLVLLMTTFAICFSHQSVLCQVEKKVKKNPYKTWVTSMDNSFHSQGYLSEIGDNHIVLMNLSNAKTHRINVNDIQTLKFRKKKRVGHGALIGALTGLAVGGIMGLVIESDDFYRSLSPNKTNLALQTSAFFSISGAVIGGLIGSIKLKVPIQGNQKTFKQQQEALLKYKL